MREEERSPKLRKLLRGFEAIRRGKEKESAKEEHEEPVAEDYAGEFRKRPLRGPKRRIF